LFLPFKEERKVRVPKDTEQKKSRQAKSAFVIRNTSADVLKSLSPRAAHLWMTLRRLADAKTGELRLPSGAFLRRARIMAEVGMQARNTFNKHLAELRRAGLAHVRQRALVTTLVTGRKHQSWSPAEYEVSEKPRQDWASCVDQCKKPHRHSGPCVDQACVDQKLSGSKIGPQILHTAPNGKQSTSHKAPRGTLALEKEKLAHDLERALLYEVSGQFLAHDNLAAGLKLVRESYKPLALALGITWQQFEKLYNQSLDRVETQLAPGPFSQQEPFDFESARLDPDCRESFLEPDGTAVLVFEHGLEVMRPSATEPDWHAF
jgi:hypothetical protein